MIQYLSRWLDFKLVNERREINNFCQNNSNIFLWIFEHDFGNLSEPDWI
mgnify:FL=1